MYLVHVRAFTPGTNQGTIYFHQAMEEESLATSGRLAAPLLSFRITVPLPSTLSFAQVIALLRVFQPVRLYRRQFHRHQLRLQLYARACQSSFGMLHLCKRGF